RRRRASPARAAAAVLARGNRGDRSRCGTAAAPGAALSVDLQWRVDDAEPRVARADRRRTARLLHAGGRHVDAVHVRRRNELKARRELLGPRKHEDSKTHEDFLYKELLRVPSSFRVFVVPAAAARRFTLSMNVLARCPKCDAGLPVDAADPPAAIECGRCGRTITLHVTP